MCSIVNNIVLKKFPMTQLMNLNDINVGGLYEIYKKNPDPHYMCSNELNSLSLLKSYSMIYIIEMLNQKLFLPSYNISIGYFIVPTCSNAATAQIQCVIKNDIRYQISLVGLIGPISSHRALYVSPLLSYYKLPHISPEANSVKLRGRGSNYLFRITSNQISYLNALLSLLRLFQWNEIAIIYSPTPNLIWYRDQLNTAATQGKFCIWHEIEIKTIKASKEMKNSFKTLITSRRGRVVFLFISDYQFEYVLNSIHSANSDPDFIYIGIDSWPSTRQSVKLGLAKMVEGAIIVSEFATESTHFFSWLLNNNESINIHHSWFSKIKNIFYDIKNDSMFNSNVIQYDKRISLSMDATMALLYSLEDLIKDKCYGMNKIQLKNCIMDNDLKYYIQNLSFYGLSGKIKFGLDRSVNNPLRIGNFLKVKGNYEIITAGNFDYNKKNESQLKLITNFIWKNYTYYDDLTAPTSRCSAPCQIEEYKMTTSSICCWICHICIGRSIFTPSNRLRNYFRRCLYCPIYKWPSSNRTVCLDMPIFYIRDFYNYWKLIIVLASIGIILAISMVIFYLKNYQATPFKLEFRSLLYLQYVGIFFGLISLFLITSPYPNKSKCGAILFFYLLSVSLIFGALSSKQSIIIKRLKINKPGLKDIKNEKRAFIMAILICCIQIKPLLEDLMVHQLQIK
ncbi:unnamed protein product [Gordionus sp. m RMFG-2023]